jgi:8-oxo-dGTP diphosphatase
MKTVETVSFILIQGGKVLVERRRKDRLNDPGAIVIPGGHVAEGENHIDAVKRELMEELGIECTIFRFFDRILCESTTEFQLNNWYICLGWKGNLTPREADAIIFLGREDINKLSLTNDKKVLTRLFDEEIS